MRKSARATLAAAIYSIWKVFTELPRIADPVMETNKRKLSEAEQALQLLKIVSDYTKQEQDCIINQKRTLKRLTTDARAIYCAYLNELMGWKDYEIAILLNMEASSIRHAIARHRRLNGRDQHYTDAAKGIAQATENFLNPQFI